MTEPKPTYDAGGERLKTIEGLMAPISTEELLRRARAINKRMCSGDHRWVMTVPVQDDDSDIVMGEVCKRLEQTGEAMADLLAIAEDVRKGWLSDASCAELVKAWKGMADLIDYVDHGRTPASWLAYKAHRGRMAQEARSHD
jgi:hypothetical protein